VAIQRGQAIFNLQASFHAAEEGLEHQIDMTAGLPSPESLPTFRERMAPFAQRFGEGFERPRPIDVRYIGPSPIERTAQGEPFEKLWFRADGPLPDDPMLHACVVTYASDMTLLDTTVRPHGLTGWEHDLQMASLDHAMWFHRPFRADEWMLYDLVTPSTSGARGLAMGSIYTQSGALAVSVVQEGLIRRAR
jgi:acyl-CoA thioesterase-2